MSFRWAFGSYKKLQQKLTAKPYIDFNIPTHVATVWGKGKQGRNLMPGTNPYQKVLTYLHGLGAKANKTIKVLTLSTQFHASSGRFTVKSINMTKYNKRLSQMSTQDTLAAGCVSAQSWDILLPLGHELPVLHATAPKCESLGKAWCSILVWFYLIKDKYENNKNIEQSVFKIKSSTHCSPPPPVQTQVFFFVLQSCQLKMNS